MHTTLLFHYNADSIITLSPRFQYFVSENVSRRLRFTQCKLWNSYSLCISEPILTPVNLPWGGVNGSLDIQCLRNQGARVLKRWLSNICSSHV